MKALSLALALLILLPGISRGENDLVVFQSTETPPIWSSSLPEHGMGGAILSLLSEAAGVQYSINYLPVKRFRNSRATFIVGDPDILDYQERRAIFPIGIFRSAFFYYKPHHDVIPIQGLKELQGHTLGVLRGTIENKEAFLSNDIKVEESDSAVSLLNKLERGRIDFAIMVRVSGLYEIKQLFPDKVGDFASVLIPRTERPMAVMINLDDPQGKEVAQRYRQVLKQTLHSRQYHAIIKQFYGAGEETRNHLERFVEFYESTWED